MDFAGLGHARHVAARLENGVVIHNFYVPAGGDVPDRAQNPKFGQKLDYLTDMRDWFRDNRPEKSILVGDLNIAPREDDVWSHKQLLKIVSHTPVEVDHLGAAQEAGGWHDVTRADIPEGQLYSVVVLPRARLGRRRQGARLDHVWASADIAAPRIPAASCAPPAAGRNHPITRRFSRNSTFESVPNLSYKGRHTN